MRIGVLGSGAVGQALGGGLSKLGHEVKMGTRDPASDKVQSWVVGTGGKTSAGTFAEAAAFAEVAILATAWAGTESAIHLAGPDHLAGKVVIDATNPLQFGATGTPTLALGFGDSAGEQVQRWLPRANVVKAFNTVGNAHMVKPEFPGGPPDLFIAGDDPDAKKTVTELAQALGWRVIDLGGIETARYIEPLAMV
ncbi:MAG: NAD(P)-binding domain-containing protein, partial [Candidatus Eisenbacteria bacterium]|nr:NAD(P)-binding domain-containing protein [Candidatus Eisenbacteria bacterium]